MPSTVTSTVPIHFSILINNQAQLPFWFHLSVLSEVFLAFLSPFLDTNIFNFAIIGLVQKVLYQILSVAKSRKIMTKNNVLCDVCVCVCPNLLK